MTEVHGRGKFPPLLTLCTRNAIHNNQAHSTKEKLKRLLFSIHLQNLSWIISFHQALVYTVPWSSSVAIVLWMYTCNLLTHLLAWEEQTGQDSMSSHHLKMLQFADKHVTRRLFMYTGSGAILVNDHLHIGICSHKCQFPLVSVGKGKEVLANFLQSVSISYRNVFMGSICNPPHCNCFNLYMLSIYYCPQV